MTLLHRLTTAYAIIVTAIMLGACHANRKIMRLEEEKPELRLTQPQRNHFTVGLGFPYYIGGILVAFAFLV